MHDRLPTEAARTPVGFPHIDLGEVGGKANFTVRSCIIIEAITLSQPEAAESATAKRIAPVAQSSPVAPAIHIEEWVSENNRQGSESSESSSQKGRENSPATVEIKEENSSDFEQHLNL